MAEYLHFKDKRRIVNALFKYFKSLGGMAAPIKESEI
jgi:hypothetical protein